MNKLTPGIFIPCASVKVESDIFPLLYLKVIQLTEDNKNELAHQLQKAGIEHVLQPAFSVSSDNIFHFGLFFKPVNPHQLAYKQAMEIISKNIKGFSGTERGYTVPMINTPAPGLGIVTKSVVAFIKNDNLPQTAFPEFLELLSKISQKLHAYGKFDMELVLSRGEDAFEIHGTSPLCKEGNPALAWQNYLSRAFKAVAPQLTPMFYQTWSTNPELTEYFTEKGRQLQAKNEVDYIAKITARK